MSLLKPMGCAAIAEEARRVKSRVVSMRMRVLKLGMKMSRTGMNMITRNRPRIFQRGRQTMAVRSAWRSDSGRLLAVMARQAALMSCGICGSRFIPLHRNINFSTFQN